MKNQGSSVPRYRWHKQLLTGAMVVNGCLGSLLAFGQTNELELTALSPNYQTLDQDSLWSVYERAKTYDAAYQRAVQEHLASQEGVKQARSRLLPDFSLFAQETEIDQDITASDIAVIGEGNAKYGTTIYGANLNQTVFDWERFMGFDQAKKQALMEDAKFLTAQQELILNVAERYIAVMAAQDNLEFFQREEAAVREQERSTQARLDAELGREADYLEARARVASVLAKRLEAENQLRDAEEGLRVVSGAGASDYQRLRDEITIAPPEPNSIESWVDQSLQGNLAIQQQRYAALVAEQEIKRLKSGHYPTLDLFARYNSQDEEGSLFGGSSQVDTLEYGVRLEIPLYQGGGTSSKVREAVHRYNAERAGLNDQVRQVLRETRSAFSDLNSSLAKVDALQQALVAQQAVVETKTRGYPRLYTSREVLDSERDLYSVRRDYAKTRYEYLLSILRLKAAAGNLSDADLQELNTLFE